MSTISAFLKGCVVGGFLLIPTISVPGATAPRIRQDRSVSVDLIPFYAVFFDVRQQIRLGMEYQKRCGKRDFATLHLDAGLYDNYTYYKYFDFFQQKGNMYFNRQVVKTYGFHLLPAWNRYLRKDTLKRMQYYAGITADINLFRKNISYFNSQTNESYRDIFNQGRLGAGPDLGLAYHPGGHFHLEARAVFIARLLMLQSDAGMKTIKPFKALWFDEHQRFWFIPQLNVCYDF